MRRLRCWDVLIVLLALVVVLLVGTGRASAQTPIVVGPNSVLAWEVVTPDIATARSLSIAATVDNAATPLALTPVSCGPGPSGSLPGTFTCSSPLAQIPTGSHSITLTAALNGVTSLASTPFAFIDFLIPIPQNVRGK